MDQGRLVTFLATVTKRLMRNDLQRRVHLVYSEVIMARPQEAESGPEVGREGFIKTSMSAPIRCFFQPGCAS